METLRATLGDCLSQRCGRVAEYGLETKGRKGRHSKKFAVVVLIELFTKGVFSLRVSLKARNNKNLPQEKVRLLMYRAS